jgi:hypothetical protein
MSIKKQKSNETFDAPNMIVGLCVDAHFMKFSLSGVRRQYFAGGNPV